MVIEEVVTTEELLGHKIIACNIVCLLRDLLVLFAAHLTSLRNLFAFGVLDLP